MTDRAARVALKDAEGYVRGLIAANTNPLVFLGGPAAINAFAAHTAAVWSALEAKK